MASTATEPEKVAAEHHVEKAAAPPPPEITAPAEKDHFALADVVLRFLLFASALVAVLVMVTSKETKPVARIPTPPFVVYRAAKFHQSPAFVFFVAALSVAGFYSLITTLISFLALLKPGTNPRLISHFVIFDVLLLGIVAAATGTAGGVAYIGLKGNKHVQWNKICNVYKGFCKHVGASIAVSLFASFVLVLLVLVSLRSLSKKIPKHNHSH